MEQTGKVRSDLISDNKKKNLKQFIWITDFSCMYGYVHVDDVL